MFENIIEIFMCSLNDPKKTYTVSMVSPHSMFLEFLVYFSLFLHHTYFRIAAYEPIKMLNLFD